MRLSKNFSFGTAPKVKNIRLKARKGTEIPPPSAYVYHHYLECGMKNILKKSLPLWAAAALLLAGCEHGVGGDGLTETGAPIAIRNAEDFAKIGRDGGYPLNGNYLIQAGNREINLSGWRPIGTPDAPFTGRINGNGRLLTIEGFAEDALSENYLGLFAVVLNAEIQNLTVTVGTGGEITLSGNDDKYVAALAAHVTGGKLKNVNAAGTLRVNKTGSRSLYAGGLAAYATGCAFEDSASAITIAATSEGHVYAGGLAAYATGLAQITNSSALGDLSGTGGDSGYTAYIGGLIGYADDRGGGLKISAANYKTGTLTAKAYAAYSGAIAGYAEGAEIAESYASGTVKAEGATPFAGGIVASLVDGTLTNAYTMTDVSSRSTTNRALAGGISGGLSGGSEIMASYTTGNVTAEITGLLAGPTFPVPGGAQAGGIAGALYGGNPSGSPAVRNSVVLEGGSVSAVDKTSGGSLHAYRVAFKDAAGAELSDNIAYAGLPLTGRTADDKGADGQDGEDTDQVKPAKAVYEGLDWDFENVWKMSAIGYPTLTGQSVNLGDYIEITDGKQLAQIGVSNSYPLDAAYRIPAGTPHIEVYNWKPIGTAEKPFTGSLTGNGTTVIYIGGFGTDYGNISTDAIGLFGYVKGTVREKALFKDLKVVVIMNSTTPNLISQGGQYVGGLVGCGEEITIDGCEVSGTLKFSKITQNPLYSGGITGYLKNGKITNSVSAVSVDSAGYSGVYSGGILGYGSGSMTVSACTSSGDVKVEAGDHNSSAGGVVGFILGTKDSTVSGCAASGNVSLNPVEGNTRLLMFYCGGVVGYAGSGTADMGDVERAGAIVEKSRYTGGTVYCVNAYPYAGGVIGYNYTGSKVTECYATGTVLSEGSRLPYAGGVAGYISGAAKVENCYSTAKVDALSTSKQALAGGIAGATAKPSLLSMCYATGQVTATIDGSGTNDMGGSLGVPQAANAGGISGSIYYGNPKVEKSVALNSSVKGIDSGTGGAMRVYRIGGLSDGDPTLDNNMAWSSMPVTGGSVADKGPDNQDGQDCDKNPAQSLYEGLGWNFTKTWRMSNGYPVLQAVP
jgi:hypothetical protein